MNDGLTHVTVWYIKKDGKETLLKFREILFFINHHIDNTARRTI